VSQRHREVITVAARGGYALVQSKLAGDPGRWRLVERKDEGAGARRDPAKTEPKSALSGHTLPEVADEEGDDDV
jgi:hypothetical protein